MVGVPRRVVASGASQKNKGEKGRPLTLKPACESGGFFHVRKTLFQHHYNESCKSNHQVQCFKSTHDTQLLPDWQEASDRRSTSDAILSYSLSCAQEKGGLRAALFRESVKIKGDKGVEIPLGESGTYCEGRIESVHSLLSSRLLYHTNSILQVCLNQNFKLTSLQQAGIFQKWKMHSHASPAMLFLCIKCLIW